MFCPFWKSPIEIEFSRFNSLGTALSKESHLIVEIPYPFCLIVSPKRAAQEIYLPKEKSIALTFMGLVHGNEWAGAAVLNELLQLILSNQLPVNAPLAFILGNPWAARKNTRFLDCDLNRNFGQIKGHLREQKRAHDLGKILQNTAFLIDFHQLRAPTDRSFFIFPFSKASISFAQLIDPKRTIVTHLEEASSKDSFASDAYVISKGGAGISLELGKAGLDAQQITEGVKSGKRALSAINELLTDHPKIFPLNASTEIYSYAASLPWPDGKFVEFVDGIKNFSEVSAGKKIVDIDGQDFCSPISGKVLFPTLLNQKQQRRLKIKPQQLCRLLRPINRSSFNESFNPSDFTKIFASK